jgi:hypothetical protein
MRKSVRMYQTVCDLEQELKSMGICCRWVSYQLEFLPKFDLDDQITQLEDMIARIRDKLTNPPATAPVAGHAAGIVPAQVQRLSGNSLATKRPSNVGTRIESSEPESNPGGTAKVSKMCGRAAAKRMRMDPQLCNTRVSIRQQTRPRIVAFIESAVHYMSDAFSRSCSEYNAITCPELIQKFGSEVPNVFSNRYITFSDLKDAVLAADSDIAIQRIGAARANYSHMAVEQVLTEWPDYQQAVKFCIRARSSHPPQKIPEIRLAWSQSEQPKNPPDLNILFKQGILSLSKIRAYLEPKNGVENGGG